jgi:hypothetical protein
LSKVRHFEFRPRLFPEIRCRWFHKDHSANSCYYLSL